MRTGRIHFQKFVEERPVVHHCLTHFFRVRFIALPSQRECASSAVILNDYRMIHRQVVRTPIEIFEGVTTRGHNLRDELIRFAYGAVRIINEARLDPTPFARKRIGLVVTQLAQVETANTISAFPENGIGACRTNSLNGPLILGAKAFAQAHASTPARVSPGSQSKQQDNHDGTNEQHEGF